MTHRPSFVTHRVQSVHMSNSERTLGNFFTTLGNSFTTLGNFLDIGEINFKMQFCNLDQLGLGSLTSFTTSM